MAYHKSIAPAFGIYDRGTNNFLFPLTPIASRTFDPFVSTTNLAGFDLKVLTIKNMTYRTPAGWVNELCISDQAGQQVHQLYKTAPYQSKASQQKTQFPFDGSWGPTIEPSDSLLHPYSGTAAVGWQNARLASRDRHGNWSNWQRLDATQSQIEPGTGEFTAKYLKPNYTGVLTS